MTTRLKELLEQSKQNYYNLWRLQQKFERFVMAHEHENDHENKWGQERSLKCNALMLP